MDIPPVNAGQATFAQSVKLKPHSDLGFDDVRCWILNGHKYSNHTMILCCTYRKMDLPEESQTTNMSFDLDGAYSDCCFVI